MGAICGNTKSVSDTQKTQEFHRDDKKHLTYTHVFSIMNQQESTYEFNLKMAQNLPKKQVHKLKGFGIHPEIFDLSTYFEHIPDQKILEDLKKNYPNCSEFKILKNRGDVITIQALQNNQKFIIKRRFFATVEKLSYYLLYLIYIQKNEITGIKKNIDYKIFKDFELKNQSHYLDCWHEYLDGSNLKQLIKNKTIKPTNYMTILQIAKRISEVMSSMHQKQLSVNWFKPSSIFILDNGKFDQIYLVLGSIFVTQEEQDFIKFFLKEENDEYKYDVVCFGFCVLSMICPDIEFNDYFKIRTSDDVHKLFQKTEETPKLIVQFLQRVITLQKEDILTMDQVTNEIHSLIQKGPQTSFESDSVSAYLSTHQNAHHDILTEFLQILLQKNVEFYYQTQNKLFDPEIFVLDFPEGLDYKVFIFSDKKKSGSSYFPCYTIEKNEKNAIIENEGPLFNDKRKSSFHFFDPHNYTIYCLPESDKIFNNGIRYYSADLRCDGEFKKDYLKFACSTDELYEEFCKIKIGLKNVQFCVEVQHGVFLLCVSHAMFILDFNFKLFYSFSSLYQLQNFEQNRANDKKQFYYAFEIRNLPFFLQYPFSSLNTNVVFQDGLLQMLCQKESQTVLCVFKILIDQAALLLLECRSCYSGEDLLLKMPLQINDAWEIILESNKEKEMEQQQQNNYEFIQIDQNWSYKIIAKLGEGQLEGYNHQDFKVIKDTKEEFFLRQILLQNLQQYEEVQKFFSKNFENSYIIGIDNVFLQYKQNQNQYYAVVVRELSKYNLEEEVRKRALTQSYYENREISFIIKCILKGVIFLHNKGIFSIDVSLKNLVLTEKQFLKLNVWFLKKSQTTSQDLDDTAKVIFQAATLDLLENQKFSLEYLRSKKNELARYPKLFNLLEHLILLTDQNYNKQELMGFVKQCRYDLQYQQIDFSKVHLEKQVLIWIDYDNNNVITYDIYKNKFKKIVVNQEDGDFYYLSKFNMFAYDQNHTLYIVDNKRQIYQQQFYSLNFENVDQAANIQPLAQIPYPIFCPTLLFAQNKVFMFGGYECTNKFDKKTSKKAFCYNIAQNQWKEIASLPISLVSSTAVFTYHNKIYLFGGVSDDIDLTGEELNYLIYDIDKNKWDFQINFSIRSPFANSRYIKPCIICLCGEIFLSFQKNNDILNMEIFELRLAGYNLKYQYDLKQNKYYSNKISQNSPSKEDDHVQYDILDDNADYFYRQLQDELSINFQNGLFRCLLEGSTDLLEWNIQNFRKPQLQIQPCSISVDQEKDHSFDEFQQKNL